MKNYFIGFIILLCAFPVLYFSISTSIYLKIFLFLLAYLLMYSGLGLILKKHIDNNNIMDFLFSKVLSLPLYLWVILSSITYIIAPAISIFFFLVFFMVPPLLLLKFDDVFHIIVYKESCIYLISLISLLFFLYKGHILIKYILNFFNVVLLKEIIEKIFQPKYIRFYTYGMMLAIYIGSNTLSFSNISLSFIPTESLNIINETFLTVVAIDSFFQLFSKRELHSKNKN